jgi:hypothetical protein
MMIFKKSIPRRTFLRGVGASVALPMLDAMIPALAGPTNSAAKIPMRVGYIYSPNGIVNERWCPKVTGSNYEMTDMLKQWTPFRDQLLVLSNLDNGNANNVSGHIGASSMFLTGMKPTRSLSDIYCGISVDQVFAREFGKETPISSLQVCLENAAELAGQSSGGYSSAYTNTISWSSPTTPLPMEHRPREIFERLFGDSGTDPEARKSRIRIDQSVLDFVRDDVSRTKRAIGADDSVKLDEYLDAIREVELSLKKAEEKTSMALPEMDKPFGIPAHEEHLRLMYDLLVLAFQTDMTRVFTFMVAREYSEMVFTQLGHTDPYHPTTHHRGDPGKRKRAGEIDVYHAQIFAEFLTKMDATKEIDGSSLLENSMMIYGAGMGNGNDHDQWQVPVMLVGGAKGKLRGGRHIQYERGTLLDQLHISMLNKAGIETESFGMSTGELDLSSTA